MAVVKKVTEEDTTQQTTEIESVVDIPSSWSFEYNCRKPSKSSKAYKDMLLTLETEPEKFSRYNSGIFVANGKYILDGGHTYLAIQDAKREFANDKAKLAALAKASVRVTKWENVSKDDMKHQSKFLNNKVTPPLRGERDLLGAWDYIKKVLDPDFEDLYEFKPNSKPGAPWKVDWLVALLHAIGEDRSPERAYASKGVLVRLYTDDKYRHVLPHLNDLVRLYSAIMRDMSKNKEVVKLDCIKDRETRIPDGTALQVDIPESLVWPVYAAFAGLLDKRGEWKAQPLNQWKAKKEKMMKQLLKDYKGIKDATRFGKTKEVYLNQKLALYAP